MRVLAQGHLKPEEIARLTPADPDARIPVHLALRMLDGAVALTGDPDVGFRAALEANAGEYDLLEYLATSSATIGETVPLLNRFVRLLNDGLEIALERQAGRATLRFASRVPLSRAAADFQLAAFYRGFAPRLEGTHPEVWLMHEPPEDLAAAQRALPHAAIRFRAPYDAILFDESLLAETIPQADPKLHELLLRFAEERVRDMPLGESLAERVRECLAGELAGGDPSAEHVARELHMSRRTLVRRLEQEGTCFKAILDDLRSVLARRYLAQESAAIGQVAELLGFSDPAAFTRAFRRWCQQSPSAYRRAQRTGTVSSVAN
ncbi:MAG TPA: AraC family transcriptional regulator ligand-binding domain-containing protein [Myxococcota bacterium]|nr:AraC family transcriptional regulator ligand-binding domain-containing protein [Myxococcota bacterium]